MNSSPERIALGVSYGVFIGVLPIYGFHWFLAIGLAILIPRVNKLALILGTNVSLLPAIPFITWASYEIGRLVLPKDYPPLTFEYFKNLTFKNAHDFYIPLIIGSLILGVICAVISYYIIIYVINKLKKNK